MLGRGVMMSSAVRRAKLRLRSSSVAVSSSSTPWLADLRTSEESSSALRAPESSSFGSMPIARSTAFALPLSISTAGLNTTVNAVWNGMTSLAVCTGRASAKFFGTSSPMIIDRKVATSIATVTETGTAAASGTPHASSSGSRSFEIAGSMVYPVSSVVSVMPSCAEERCVEVILSARMVSISRDSPRAWRASSSARSRFTSANSLATNRPVPTMRRSPTPSSTNSIS